MCIIDVIDPQRRTGTFAQSIIKVRSTVHTNTRYVSITNGTDLFQINIHNFRITRMKDIRIG